MNFTKRLFMLCAFAGLALSSVAAEKLPEFKDHTVVGVNRLPSRSSFWYYSSRDQAANPSYLIAPDNLSLNGEWSFSFAERPADRKADFYKANYDVSSWDKIAVPGSWPLQGYDKPIYLNHPYEFNTKKPFPIAVPDEWNPVGSYRRNFVVPREWKGERIVLHFGAVKSSFYVWVNGKKVGYSQDSKMQAEFDITPYVKFGAENSVSVEVYRFSVGSYLEGQDMWRLAGIKRDVWVYATPKNYVADFFAAATLEDNYTKGVLNLEVELEGRVNSRSKVGVELMSPNADVVYRGSVKPSKSGVCSLSIDVENVEAWSDEHPNLYTLILSYNDRYVGSKVGFRSVELKNSQLLINGKAIRVKGVNRHEHHPKFGHYVPAETMERDVELMKLFNVNAIRTSHYPCDPYLYELADKNGLFICDEANIETHGLGAALQAYYDPAKHISDNPEWESLYHDRIFRMFNRDKNHPSVILWSMGNECGDGVIFRDGYKKLKEVDPTRLVLFEQAGMQSHTDIVAPMYMTMDKIENYARATDTYRPMILAEYAHAMGNSLGNFDDEWELFEKYPNLQGGFIWDWVDQGMEDFHNGERFLDYGGAFGLQNMRNDGPFCLNGIVNPDREPNPHAYQMRKVYDNVDVRRAQGGANRFAVLNKFRFTNLDQYTTHWSLMCDGVAIESGEIALECAPEWEQTIELPFTSDLSGNHDYHVNFSFMTKSAEGMIPADYVVASEQLELKRAKSCDYVCNSESKISMEKSAEGVTVEGDDFAYKFDAEGRISSMIVGGEQFMQAPAEYDFYRVKIDNDGWNKTANSWKSAHERTELKAFDAVINEAQTQVTITATNYIMADVKQRLNGDFTTVYTIYADGAVAVDNTFIPTSYHAEQVTTLPRLGERYILSGDFDSAEWYGRGPWENYADRKSSAFVGQYVSPIDELMHHYIRPQESGYRTDVRNVKLSANGGRKSLKVECRTPLCFNASFYPKEAYFQDNGKGIRNTFDLKRSENLYFNIDYGQTGVGGDNSWGNPVHVQYQILMRAYNYGYILKPQINE